MRIAIFVSEFPALSETFVMRQVVGLIERGHDVTVFADRPRGESMTHTDFERHGLAERTRYLAMPSNRVLRVLLAFGHLMMVGPRRTPALLRSLNVFRHGRDAASLRLFFWAVRLLGQPRFDVLHCHFGPVGGMVETLRDIGAVQGRLATTFHGADLTACLRDRPERYRDLVRSGDLFLPISDYLRQRLLALGCQPSRLAVLRMGVDLDRFVERPRSRIATGPLSVLTVGRLVDKKGVADGLRAVAAARRRGIELRYTIIGDGPLRGRLEALAGELAIEDAVSFKGWCLQDAIVEALYEHDVLLAPSITAPDGDQEGIPVTLMEAMATGMPVVTTRHSGIPELVEDGVSGLLADEGDYAALADALKRLSDSPELARSIGRAARLRVSEIHDADALDEQLDRRLRTLVGAAA